MPTTAAITDALAVLDQFSAAFNRQDPAGMDAALHFPHVFPGPTPLIWHAPGGLPQDFFAGLVASGWAVSRYVRREPILVSPDCVHVLVEYERCRADGSVLSRQCAMWIVVRRDGRWGIQVRSNQG